MIKVFKGLISVWCVVIIITIIIGCIKLPKTSKGSNVSTVHVYSDNQEYFTNHELEGCEYDKNYKNEFVKDVKKADIILTYDKELIPKNFNAKSYGYSPLICVMNENIESYITEKNKKGFIDVEKNPNLSIGQKENDFIMNFKRVIEVLASNGNLSNLGGENKEIKIYCPKFEGIDGMLFKQFVEYTIVGENKTATPEENKMIETFLSSSNLVQTDVIDRLSKLGNQIPDNEIYVVFEHQFSHLVKNLISNNAKYSYQILYPQKTVIKNIYIYSENKKLLNMFISEKSTLFHHLDHSSDFYSTLYDDYWRTEKFGFYVPGNEDEKYKIQGINTFVISEE